MLGSASKDWTSSRTDPEEQLRDELVEALEAVALLGADDLELILWAADYYRQPPGEALFSALPARLRRNPCM